MPFGKDGTAAQVSHLRLNGLRLQAKVERRTIAAQLDLILEKAGVPELSDKQYEAELKKAGLDFLEAKA